MPGKPTYKEIERRLKKLDKEAVIWKRTEEALRESEKRFKNVTNSIQELLVLLDHNFKVQMINSTLAKAYNVSLDKYKGKYCYELFYRRNHICEGCPAFKALNEGKVIRDALRYRPDGRIIDRIAYPFIDDKNDISGVIVIGVDITQQKQAEEKLRESEERFRKLAEGSFEAIVLHEEGVILEANNQYYEMFGYNPDELAGKDAISLTATPESVEIIKKQISLANFGPYEVDGLKKDGTKFPMEVRIKLTTYNGHKVRMGVIRDLTEQKQAEAALKERAKKLKIKKDSLEELNTAMKVLLKKREEDKIGIEKNVLTNVKELIRPSFERIKKTELDDQQKALLSIIESNINEIVSPFTRTMSLKYLNLTPSEIQIANLIRHGSKTKEIAELMNISPKTVETHRRNIRRKIGLDGKQANLRSHLLSFH